MLLFERDGELRAAAWTTDKTAHVATLPGLAAGAYRVTNFNGEVLPPEATAGADGLRLELSDAPKYMVRK
jgi:hypothetical protein